MNFQQLEYVIALNHHRHFGKAAEACHVTQATLSGMIKKLEEEVGYQIFDRSHQPVKITESGVGFLAIANDILKRKNELYNLKDNEDHLTGVLRIGVIPTVATSLLPLVLSQITSEQPNLKLEIKEITTDEIQKELVSDAIDIGILATPLNNDILEEFILYYEAMMIYGVDGDSEYISTSNIDKNKVWLLEEGHCFRDQTIDVCNIKPRQMHDEQIVFRGSSFDTLLSMTDKFGGITLIPELYFHSLSEKRKTMTKHFRSPVPVREISIVAYRPFVKKKSIAYLSQVIKNTIEPLLAANQLKNQDMQIIGI